MTNVTTLTALMLLSKPRLDGTAPEDRTMTRAEWQAAEQERLAKKSATDLVDELVKVKADNYELRRKSAPDGGLILDAEQAKRWAAWEALGTIDQITPKLEQAGKDRARIEQIEKRERITTVAQAAGWDADALSDLDSLAGGLDWTVSEVTGQDGNSVKSVTVKVDGKDVDAGEFAKQRWSKFLPVLQLGNEREQSTPEPITTRVPTGGAGGGKPRSYSQSDAEKRLSESGQYDM